MLCSMEVTGCVKDLKQVLNLRKCQKSLSELCSIEAEMGQQQWQQPDSKP